MKIQSIKGKSILDSRGKDTVEVEVKTKEGVFISSTPSGTSSGSHEAIEKPAEEAVQNINGIIAEKFCGKEFKSQEQVDSALIAIAGKNKTKLGVNAVLPVSIACCRAFAKEQNLPLYSYISKISNNSDIKLPVPSFLLIEGAKHAENTLNVQEFMVVPNEKTFSENYKTVKIVYNELKERLEEKFGKQGIAIGMEGGFTPKIRTTKQALDLIFDIVKKNNCKIALDVAASEFYENAKYNFEGKETTSDELSLFYKELIKYPIVSIEDPFAEDDIEGWKKTKELRDRPARNASHGEAGGGVLIVGDDLTVTNTERIVGAYEQNLCNAVILKPNQIGTVTETIKSANLAKEYGWKRIVSHRSGDTMDDFIADLSVGISAEFIKSGSSEREERKIKYDRLLQIEQDLL